MTNIFNHYLKNNILPNSFFDFKVFVAPDASATHTEVLGAGKKHTLWVLKDEPSLEVILEKMLTAAKLDKLEDIFLLKILDNSPFALQHFIQSRAIRKVVFMGVSLPPLGINLQLPHYQVVEVGKVQYLTSHSLSKLNEEPSLKRDLWAAIQALFELRASV